MSKSKTSTPKANPALAATEKARKAVVAEIDARLAKGQQDHEVPTEKEMANNAENEKAARAAEGPKAASAPRKAKAPRKPAHGPTSAPKRGARKGAKPAPKAKAAKGPRAPRKLSALDAAAQVLASSSRPLTSKDLIDTMASKGLWTSPGGKTPEATLYAAMTREIARRGTAARFKKHSRGLFVAGPRKGA